MIQAARYAPGPLCNACAPPPREECTVAHGRRSCLACSNYTENGCALPEDVDRAKRAQRDTLDEIGGTANDTDPSPPPEDAQ